MRRSFRLRLRVISAAIALIALLIVSRLYFVQVVHGEEYLLRAERQYVHASQELFDRGSIYFTKRDGTQLSAATLATGFQIAIDPNRLENPESEILPEIDR
jgi:cell division protein FtsI/penicillin-binding protein 2